MNGYCDSCRRVVVVNGQQGNAEGTIWSHLRESHIEFLRPGHAYECEGDCERHGCPIPVLDYRVDVVECGPVHVCPDCRGSGWVRLLGTNEMEYPDGSEPAQEGEPHAVPCLSPICGGRQPTFTPSTEEPF